MIAHTINVKEKYHIIYTRTVLADWETQRMGNTSYHLIYSCEY